MTGAFGLADDVCHARIPPERLIQNRARIDVWRHLHQSGALVDGTTTQLQVGQNGYLASTRGPNIFLGGICVPIVWD